MDVGAELRTAREGKKLSIDAVAQRTRIPQRAIAAIERNDLGSIPPRPFGRGFVRSYAMEVGLDGDHMAREYFAQLPPVEPAPEPKKVIHPNPEASFDLSSQWAGLITALVLLVLVVAAAVSIGRGRESRSEPDAVGTVGAAPTAPAKDDAKSGTAPLAATESKPATAVATTPAQTTPLKLDFSVSRACWVAANVDGQQSIYRIIQAGENHSLTASREIAIRFGDSNAVTWTLNGRKGESLGAAGVVRDLLITPENAATIR